MTYAEFLEWADEDVHAEWINGEVIVHLDTDFSLNPCLSVLIRVQLKLLFQRALGLHLAPPSHHIQNARQDRGIEFIE